MVTTRMPWAVWYEYGKYVGNGSFSNTSSKKIVLFTTTTTDRPPQYYPGPAHFSMDLSPGGKVWQHVPLDKPAYLLTSGYEDGKLHNPNYDAGQVIQIEIITPSDSVDVLKNWTDSRYERLGYYCAQIMSAIGGVTILAAPFDLNLYGKANPNRVKWSQFSRYGGILGGMHTPYNNSNRDPGNIDAARMQKYLTQGNVSTSSGTAPSTTPSGGSQTSTTSTVVPTTTVTGTTTLQPNLHGMPMVIGDETYILGQEYVSEVASVYRAATAPLVEVDGTMTNKTFRFNPPLHPLNLPVRVDFSSNDPNRTLRDQYLDERAWQEPYNNPDNLKQLRLGRIIQHEKAAGMAAVNKERYGFRFLYNPTAVTITSRRNDSVISDSRSAINAVISGVEQDFQLIDMKLLLNRMPDVMMHDDYIRRDDYMPSISQEDFEGLRKYGTHWDLEILYRVCNGIWSLADRGITGDVGYIQPSNARLLLGPEQNHFGFVEAIEWTDLMFNGHMVPVRTEVTLRFRRHVDMAPGALFQVEGAYMADEASVIEEALRLEAAAVTNITDDSLWLGLGFSPLGLGINFTTALAQFWSNKAAGGAPTTPTTTTPGTTPDASAPVSPDAGASAPNNRDAPVPGYNKVTSGWYYGSGGLHGAWDYGSGGIDGKSVHCTKDGVIVRLRRLTTSYGIHCVVKTGTVYHYYCHMRDFAPGLKEGQAVTAGTHLGWVGSTGRSTGPHLHYEEREGDKQYSRHPQWGVALPGSKS